MGRGFKVNIERLKKLGKELSGTLECLEEGLIARCLDDKVIIKNLIKHQIKIVDAIIEDTSDIKIDKIARMKKIIRIMCINTELKFANLNSEFIYTEKYKQEDLEKELDDLLKDL